MNVQDGQLSCWLESFDDESQALFKELVEVSSSLTSDQVMDILVRVNEDHLCNHEHRISQHLKKCEDAVGEENLCIFLSMIHAVELQSIPR